MTLKLSERRKCPWSDDVEANQCLERQATVEVFMSYRRVSGGIGRLGLSVLIALSLVSAPRLLGQGKGGGPEKGGGDETGAYEVVPGWPKPLPDHEGWASAPVTATFAESPDRVFFIQRGELKLPEGRRGNSPIFATPGRSATSAGSG